jgi:type VI secretion system ImpH/TssG family protein
MARPDRPPDQHLGFIAAIAEEARRFGLFPVVRGAEARALNRPRVGQSRLPSQNIVDLSQTPTLAFPDSTLDVVEVRGGRPHVSGYWLGLTGPMGPLPIHLTEFATYERRYAKIHPFGRWLDMLAGRMLQFFYRAWANSQPSAVADRPDDDRFAEYLAALSGATEGVGAHSAFPAKARLHYAGLFAGSRSAPAIEDALCHLLRQPVRLIEYQPRWRLFEADDVSRLGHSFATLGSDAVLGGRVRSAADAFRVVIRATSFRDYQSLLPTGARFAVAAEALDAFKPSHLEWDLALEIAEKDMPRAKLDGRSQLGWSGWMKKPGKPGVATRDAIRADAHLRRIRRPKSTKTGDKKS